MSLLPNAAFAVGNLPALLTGTVTLALAANTYELPCISGIPLVFTRALTPSELSNSGHYFYLALYNVIYALPLLMIGPAFNLTLGSRKLTETQGRVLKLLSGSMMLGLVLLLAPLLLDHWLTAIALLALAALVTCGGPWRPISCIAPGGHLQTERFAMPNGLHPDLMTPAERLDEIAEILAAGVLRARRKLRGEDRREPVRLDFSPDRSMHADRSRRRRRRDASR